MDTDGQNLNLTEEQRNQVAMYNEFYAKMIRRQLVDAKGESGSSVAFSKYTKSDILGFLQNPIRNEKNIRNASVYMYTISSHYRSLIDYYAKMPTWAYVINPYKFDPAKAKPENVYKQYLKAIQYVENMNIKHEFQKILTIAMREDVFFGVCWEDSNSFLIQALNPDHCKISNIEDGVYQFMFDFSKIKENELFKYPQQFTTLYNNYKRDKLKYQEVPSDISICIKANEDLDYPLPVFCGVLPDLHDIEDYKSLMKQRTEVGNYKAITLEIPIDKDGVPTLNWNDAQKYYTQMLNIIPENIGCLIAPLKLDSLDFEKSGLAETDEVHKAEQHFWSSAGTSSLLFGGEKSSSSVLKLAIKSNEEFIFGILAQFERWLNFRLKKMSGTVKFKATMLPITVYNQEEKINQYKNSATYGVPVKSYISAAQGQTPSDMIGASYLEETILNLSANWIPLSSSHTQSSSSDTGRPTNESIGVDVTDDVETQQENGSNNDSR